MQSIKGTKMRLIISGIMAFVLCLALCGCGGEPANEPSNEPATNTTNTGSSAPVQQQEAATSAAEAQAPIITTAYLQEGMFGDNNIVAFIINQREGEVVSMKIFYGNVEVTGNSTFKQNYTMSTTTVNSPNPDTFEASFSSGEGSIAGSISSANFAGTVVLPGVGEFVIDAPVTESKKCSSCNGIGTGTGAGASTCSFCNGVGTLISYKGTYI